jgi:hypothetical protein
VKKLSKAERLVNEQMLAILEWASDHPTRWRDIGPLPVSKQAAELLAKRGVIEIRQPQNPYRDLTDVFNVQDEIASAVVTALKVHLLSTQLLAARDELRTGNIEAYNQYLQGKESYNQGDQDGYSPASGRRCAFFGPITSTNLRL